LLSNLVENLREFESICKTVLAHESGDPGYCLTKKTEGRKSHDTVPLTDGIIQEKSTDGITMDINDIQNIMQDLDDIQN
jgi:hypothetical protein